MQRIGWYDVLTNVKRVCKHWYVLSKDPSIWRVIEFRRDVLTTNLREDMEILSFEEYVSQVPLLRKDRFDYSNYREYEAKETALHVIDLSCGQLQDLCFQNFGCDNLFKYIYQRYSIYYIYKYKTIEEGIDPEEDNAILQRKHVAASEEHQRLIQEALASRRVKSTENNFNIDAMGDMAEGDALFGSSDEIVKGYRFSILYPDLIDTEAPTYTTEKDGDSVETLIIRFHAGPPYEDIAFRILNNEWECSAKKGFKCTFERGILHLNINFKQHPYRRILG
ncbi:hypothetical protein POM88_026939 [Heracleum sosnowskyi]|uniref:Splicing factor Cactin C-terminal domain-containing protein n=1 Tax=Heracleum sosnowskyi TaxID=360622 RepID=A0AAD8I7N9_9APIA|nr:hypothetical protein POM88_026939 [Heracleum sosnowskyi]